MCCPLLHAATQHRRDNCLGEVISSRAASSLLPRDVPEKQSGQGGPATAAGPQPRAQIDPSGCGSLTLGKQRLMLSFHLCRKPGDFCSPVFASVRQGQLILNWVMWAEVFLWILIIYFFLFSGHLQKTNTSLRCSCCKPAFLSSSPSIPSIHLFLFSLSLFWIDGRSKIPFVEFKILGATKQKNLKQTNLLS